MLSSTFLQEIFQTQSSLSSGTQLVQLTLQNFYLLQNLKFGHRSNLVKLGRGLDDMDDYVVPI